MNGEYRIVITKSAQKDKEKIKALPALKNNVDIPFRTLRRMNASREVLAHTIPAVSIVSTVLFILLTKQRGL